MHHERQNMADETKLPAGFSLACSLVFLMMVPARAQTSAEPGPVLHLADQRLPDARLIDITETGGFTFQLGGQAGGTLRTFGSDQIVRWGKQRASGGSALVWLADGSWLAGGLQWKTEQTFELVSDWFAPTELAMSQVRGLVLQPSPSLRRFSELEQEMLRATGSADVIWNARSEQLSGVLSLRLQPAIDAGQPPSVGWLLKTTAAAEAIELESGAIQAIVLSPILRRPMRVPPRAVQWNLRDGSQLNVIATSRTPEGRVRLTLADQRVLITLDNSTQFATAIARITAEPESVQWLSDLEPARYRFAEEPGELTWRLGRDEDLYGEPLMISGEGVPHGIAMHASSQVAYRWDGRAAKLLAEVSLYGTREGLPTPIGSAECKVLVARDGKLVEIFQSPVLRTTTPAVPIELDVSDAQLIVLLVEQADQGRIGDQVLWRDVRLVPMSETQTQPR